MPSQAQGILQRKMAVPEPRALRGVTAQKSTSFCWVQHVSSSAGVEVMRMGTTL